jgi:hypothetical protein
VQVRSTRGIQSLLVPRRALRRRHTLHEIVIGEFRGVLPKIAPGRPPSASSARPSLLSSSRWSLSKPIGSALLRGFVVRCLRLLIAFGQCAITIRSAKAEWVNTANKASENQVRFHQAITPPSSACLTFNPPAEFWLGKRRELPNKRARASGFGPVALWIFVWRKSLDLKEGVGANGFEPSTSWSRTNHVNPIALYFGVAYGATEGHRSCLCRNSFVRPLARAAAAAL